MRIAEARVLADRLILGEGLLWDVARVVAANALLVLCAQIALPLPWTPVPVTGQTFGVMLVAVLLGARRAAFALGLYLLEGLGGLPVFQPFGAPGAARLAGPTAGYLLAYPVAAFITGWLVEHRARGKLAADTQAVVRESFQLLGALLAGEFIVFAGGCGWLATVYRMGWNGALEAGAAPFVVGEMIKMALVVAAVRGIERAAFRR